MDLARRQPGQLNVGNPGNGTSMHLDTGMFGQGAGIRFANIPCKGQPPVLIDMLRGEVHFSVHPVGIATPQGAAGKTRAQAVVADKRRPSMPEVRQKRVAPGLEPQAAPTPEPINAMIRSDFEKFRATMLGGNIRAE